MKRRNDMKKLRSVLSFLMVLALCLSLVTAAFAAEEEEAAVEEVIEEVAEEAAEPEVVAYDGAENNFADVEANFPGGSFYRRNAAGVFEIEIGNSTALATAIADGTVNCKSGGIEYHYVDSTTGNIVSVPFSTEDLHVWIVNDKTNADGWDKGTATCEEDGVYTRKCDKCGKVETKPQEKLGHKWASESDDQQWGEVIVEPTCTTAGKAQDYCLNGCGSYREVYRDIEALDHDYQVVFDKYPTCKANSYDGTDYEITDFEFHLACVNCGDVVKDKGKTATYTMTKNEFDSPYGWDYQSGTITWAVTTGSGRTAVTNYYTMSMENARPVYEDVRALAENGYHGAYELVYYKTAPKCDTEGVAVYHCAVCGLREEVVVPALNHGLSYDMELSDTGELKLVRNKLLDCWTQTQEWKCELCNKTFQGIWVPYSGYAYDYDLVTGVETITPTKYHYFEELDLNVEEGYISVESHIFDTDLSFEVPVSGKKFSVDLTKQNIGDLYKSDLVKAVPTIATPTDMTKENLDAFCAWLKTTAEDATVGETATKAIEGLVKIATPTDCGDTGYLLISCINIDDGNHDALKKDFNGPISSSAKAGDSDNGKYYIMRDDETGEYSLVMGKKDGGSVKWVEADTKVYKIYTIGGWDHDWDSWQVRYLPNQDGNGNKNGNWERKCKICGEVDSVIQEYAPVKCADGAHKYEAISTTPATCVETGLTTYICNICGDSYEEVLPLVAHTAVNVDAVVATETEDGMTAGTKCSVCGEILSGCEVIPAVVENTYAVNTSDIKIVDNAVVGSGKIEKASGNQPLDKLYVYVTLNYERADGTKYAIALPYQTDSDGSFDIIEYSTKDKLVSVVVIGEDAKVGASFAGHLVGTPQMIEA